MTSGGDDSVGLMTDNTAVPPRETLRERKKRKTRQALVESALALFAERGYDASTIDEITDIIDVSRRTFFRYFGSKEDVLFYDYDDLIAEFRAELANRMPFESSFDALRRAGRVNAETWKRELEENREMFVLRLRLISTVPALLARDIQLNMQWEEAVAEALAADLSDEPNGRLHADLLAGATIGAVRAVVRAWEAGGFEADIVELVDEVFDVLEKGLKRSTPRLLTRAK